MEDNKYYVTWTEYIGSINTLANDIKNCKFKFDYIHYIPRGGMAIAMVLSYVLDIPIVHELNENMVDKVNHYLIIDDLVDTGSTFLVFADKFNRRIKYKTACLYMKDKTHYSPHFVACLPVIPTNQWVVLPYDKQDCNSVEETQKHLKRTMMLCEDNRVNI